LDTWTPKTYKDAMKRPDLWWEPIEHELEMLKEKGVFEVVCQRAKLHAGIKPTALCSALDKENSIEFPLDFKHYLYNYYMVCALFSHVYHVTLCDVIL